MSNMTLFLFIFPVKQTFIVRPPYPPSLYLLGLGAGRIWGSAYWFDIFVNEGGAYSRRRREKKRGRPRFFSYSDIT